MPQEELKLQLEAAKQGVSKAQSLSGEEVGIISEIVTASAKKASVVYLNYIEQIIQDDALEAIRAALFESEPTQNPAQEAQKTIERVSILTHQLSKLRSALVPFEVDIA